MTEQELWNQFTAGSKKAYAQIYEIFAPDLYAFGLHFTNDKTIVEDAIHDLFVSLYQRKDKLAGVKSIKAYLFTSLRNELLRVFKSEKLIFQLDSSEFEDSLTFSDLSVEDDYIDKELNLSKRRFIKELEKCLTPREKEVIYHRYMHQLSIKSIADLMGINSQSTKNLIYTSILKMRKKLAIPFLIYFTTFIK